MRLEMHHLSIRADALFVSEVQRSEDPTADDVRQAVATAVGAFGSRGCAERVAQEFGDHPDAAIARMRWAREITGAVFGQAGRQPAAARSFPRPSVPAPRRAA